MKHAWQVRRHPALWVLLILLLCLHAVEPTQANKQHTKCIRSVPRSFTQTQQERLCIGSHARQDPTAPGQCAKLALAGRAIQTAKFASRIELLRAASIIQLCSGSSSSGPAKCWLAVPTQQRQQMLISASTSCDEVRMEPTAAAIPLVQICRQAQDDRPAKCLLLWLEMSKTLSKRDAFEVLETAAALCKAFDGQVAALKQCVKQSQPHLRFTVGNEIGTLLLCRQIGDGSKLAAIMTCAIALSRKRILPSAIAKVCGDLPGVDFAFNTEPHTCFVEAQQKLRWMNQDAQITLCKDAAAGAAVIPIDCALEMRTHARSLLPTSSLSSPTPEFGILVAGLCHRAKNATTVIECIRLLPVRVFTVDQILRLCAASTMPVEHPDVGSSVSHYPTSCASKARILLQRSVSFGGPSDPGMTLSTAAVQVCEHATSDAPSKCLTDTQHDHSLSASLRVQLCRQATSDAPQLCLESLRRFINTQRLDIHDAVSACHQTESLGPAECVKEFLQATGLSTTGAIAAQLCHGASNLEPARCFKAAPLFYDDELKVSLCNQAENTAPASCVDSVITRIANQPAAKVALCRGATTSAPAACAIEAPFGMDETSLIVLCRSATGVAPARCAHEVPVSLRVPYHRVAQVCAGATSTTPGRCLAHRIRHSRLHRNALQDNHIDCRQAVAHPSTLGIAQASYNCPELRPMCPLQLVLNVLDQYGDPMVENHHYQTRGTNVVYVQAVFAGSHDKQLDYISRRQPAVQGPSYATIVNGSASFSNLLFTTAGEFTLTFRAGEGVTEEVARVLVYPDHAAEALQTRCDELFTHFQCAARTPPSPTNRSQQREMQMLLLPRALHLNSISCGQYWLDNIGGLSFSGFYSGSALFTLPRPLYDLFTSNMDIPHVGMSAWELLGLHEGETNRTTIRRAYHQRSLEWHPDKWHTLTAALHPLWQEELNGVYALITQAYDHLTRS